jgi:methionyl aminopeptidase
MNDEVYENYIFAGKVAAKARKYGAGLLKPNTSLLDIAENVESKILEQGASLAFPVNISINEIAAHFSPKFDDEKLFLRKGDVVKLDLGSHFNGYIADTAVTVEIESNNYSKMIESSNKALENVLDFIKPKVSLFEIGKIVQDTITSYGFKPVCNLTGHSLQRYILHAGKTIPNVSDLSYKDKLRIDDVLAIEPFSTDGAGQVVTGEGSNIYLCKNSFNPRLIRNNREKMIYRKAKEIFKTLPFAQRWFEKKFSNSDILLRKLSFLGLIKHYPQLIDANKGIVTQKEHTVIITEGGCEVIT